MKADRRLHVVLYQPEIPQNTGNIMRTCAGTDTRLHLIKPMGFKLTPKWVKRSGVNYIHHTDYTVYENWDDFKSRNPGEYVFFTRYGKKPPDAFDFSVSDKPVYLIFGRESTGIPKTILRDQLDRCTRLPMNDKIRSLNLSNVVAIGLYEALRQRGYGDLHLEEPDTLKGPDWLLND
jgi:tRNA (cytidine/uridine-2'-O-)-methyltransferase